MLACYAAFATFPNATNGRGVPPFRRMDRRVFCMGLNRKDEIGNAVPDEEKRVGRCQRVRRWDLQNWHSS